MSGPSRNCSRDVYCPLSMTRFDSKDKVTIWRCHLCEKHLLSKDSVRQHLSHCARRIIIHSISLSDCSESDVRESDADLDADDVNSEFATDESATDESAVNLEAEVNSQSSTIESDVALITELNSVSDVDESVVDESIANESVVDESLLGGSLMGDSLIDECIANEFLVDESGADGSNSNESILNFTYFDSDYSIPPDANIISPDPDSSMYEYKCLPCGVAFNRRSKLKTHIRAHKIAVKECKKK